MKASLSWRLGLLAAGLALAMAAPLHAIPIDVVEEGVGADEIVNISSSTLGSDLEVYACSIDILIDGQETQGFCIDPWHWSLAGTMDYNSEELQDGPKNPGPMNAQTALQIEQLWQQYYSPTMSDQTAAGLQIAIWDIVTATVEAATDDSAWFTLNSGDDYGASSMIAWVDSDPTAAAANLVAITGPGQDYVVAASALPQEPPDATIDAAPTAYTGSPFHVSSTATAPDDNLTLHSIEWMGPDGTWTVNTTDATGGEDDRTLGINFPQTGVFTLRAGASVDNGNTWVYSANVTVTVTNGLTNYAFESMAVPGGGSADLWYSPSPVAEKTYEVQHTNP